MAFVPPSSLLSGTITVAGTVAVSNFPASQPVTGPLTALELLAMEPLGVTVANFPALQAVTQGTSPWVVDGSAVTQPISAETLPLPDGAADNETLSEVALTAVITREAVNVG